jgi:translation elongation factor EF-4
LLQIKIFEMEKYRERNDEVYSKVIKAGKRTYFFDIKSTKGNDLYLTITESKKTFENGIESYQKHKIFLYKEDFEKFKEGFEDVISKIEELKTSDSQSLENKDVDSLTFESL